MVYRGKPSSACHQCRRRRIKCDKEPLGCSQCSGIRSECPGYRNPLDMYFRDENDSVIKKAKACYKLSAERRRHEELEPKRYAEKHNGTHRATRDEWTAAYSAPDFFVPVLWYNPSHSIENVGIAHFMTSYVPGSRFEYLPKLYSQSGIESPLSAIIHAASIASISQELGETRLMESARRSYSRALALTNAAIADNASAVQDSTLVSVLLLGLFEALVSEKVFDLGSWTTHIRGALALLKLRGQQQFHTDIGRQLFIQIGNCIRVSCIQQKIRIPPALDSLLSEAKAFFAKDDPKIALAILVGELTELLVSLKERSVTSLHTIQQILQLDRKFAMLSDTLPISWRYTDIPADDNSFEAYGKTIHKYPNHHVAQMWNSIRMIRILLNELVHEHVIFFPEPATSTPIPEQTILSLLQQAVNNIAQISNEICASVPQLFARSSSISGLTGSNFPVKAHAASLLWPLSVVRGALLAPETTRVYAIDKLRHLGHQFKLRQAVTIADTTYERAVVEERLYSLGV